MKIDIKDDKLFTDRVIHLIMAYEYSSKLKEIGISSEKVSGLDFMMAPEMALGMIFDVSDIESNEPQLFLEILNNKDITVEQKYTLLCGIDNNIVEG